MTKFFSCCMMVSRGILFMAATLIPVAAQQAVRPGTDRFESSGLLPQTMAGTAMGGKKVSFANLKASSLAAGDFYEDGIVSLATGYAVPDGGVVALQRGVRSTLAAGNGALAASRGAALPLAEAALLIDAGIRPDLLKTADVNGDGHLDLIVATQGRSAVRIFLGDGRGKFGAPMEIATSGRVLALATWHEQGAGRDLIVLGVCGAGCSVGLYRNDGTVLASIPIEAERISVLEVARMNGSPSEDLVVGGGSNLGVIDGRTVLGGPLKIERLPVSGAVAAVAGSFVYDRRGLPQIAVLTRDGSLHILARAGVDASPLTLAEVQAKRQALRLGQHSARATAGTAGLAWIDAETLSSVAVPDGGTTPLLLRSHLSGSGDEDLIALNVNGGQITTIRHPVVSTRAGGGGAGALAAGVLPAVVTREAISAGNVEAAIQVRLSQDSRASLVMAQGQARPTISLPASSRTITVNTTNDSAVNRTACINGTAGCSLRSALAVVGDDAGTNEGGGKVDTVNVPAGNYVLSSNSGLDSQGSKTYHVEIAGPVNIVGAGTANTTITSNNQDKIFSINSGVVNVPTGFDVFISNLTMTDGTNPNDYNVQPTSNTYGGLMDWESSATGNLTISNCNFTNGTVLFGPGGALYASTAVVGPGALEIDGGTISGNRTPEEGGGLYAADDVQTILSGVTVTANKADPAVNSADAASGGSGGGALFGQSAQVSIETSIVNSVFSSNTAATGNGDGGGLLALSGITITNTKFTGNSAGGNGGGIYVTDAYFAPTFTGLTVTGNTARAEGGGITVQAFDTTKTLVQYSRIVGNTTGGAHTGLANGVNGGNQSSTVNAAYNFWGCNGAATGEGCDTAGNDGGTGSLTLTPYAKVSASLSPNPGAVGAPFVLSGDLAHDSTGAAIPNANLTAFAGVNATLNIAEGATSLYSATIPLSSAASASASGTPTAAGLGTASFKVDNAPVSIPFSVISPASISSSFGAPLIRVGTATSLTFTVANPSPSTVLSGLAFTDTLPAGLVVATPSGLSTSCGGTFSAVAGGGGVLLSGGLIAAGGSCSISLNVLATTAGVKTNTTSALSTTNGGTGLGTTATLNVNAPVVDTLAFGAASVALGGSTPIRYTLANPAANASSLTGVTFSNTLPVGLVIATPNSASSTCAGTLTATAATGIISLTSVTIPVGTSCTVTVNVTAKSSGVKSDSFTASSDTIGAGNTASASITVTASVFAPPISYLTGSTGAGSLMVATADFNGDGVPDLAIANLSSASVSVLLGNSDGTFRAPATYTVGYGPYGIVAGDFNKDGKPDIAVVNGGDATVSILLNSGTGTFPATPTFTYSVGNGPYGISLIDFNKDGSPDLAVTNNGAKTISVLKGTANGSFTAAGTYPTGNYPLGTAVADVNGDGYADLIVWNTQDGTVGVLLNNTTGGFNAQVTYAVGSDPYSVAVGDFNGDGFVDLAVANLGSNTVGVLLNDKTGKFLAQVPYATGVEPTSVLVRDMNGDGVLDLVVTNIADGTVGLLPGNGNGTFLPQVASSAGLEPYAALAADFNGDGTPDLAVTNFTTNSIAILLQTPAPAPGQLVKPKSPSRMR